MIRKVVLGALVGLLVAVMFPAALAADPPEAELDLPSDLPPALLKAIEAAEVDVLPVSPEQVVVKGTGFAGVPPGGHGDAFKHNTCDQCSFSAPSQTTFLPSEPLWMRVYVTSKYTDTFYITYYVWDKFEGRLYKYTFDGPLGAENWCVCSGWPNGMGKIGQFLFFAKVTTASGGTKDWRFFPLARFSVVVL